jgi:hypothetical protein
MHLKLKILRADVLVQQEIRIPISAVVSCVKRERLRP